MNIIFLRGSVPPKKEHPEKLLYTEIEKCEDQWTQLFYYLTKSFNARAELLYDNGKRKFKVDKNFTEKWIPDFSRYKPNFKPDLIICRGGFSKYDNFLKRYPKSKKVYYGAGKRFFPQTNYTKYDLFLCDSKNQLKKIKQKGKNVKLFIKPAATLFKNIETKKEYDICFIANASQEKIKRHKLFLKSLAGTKYKILQLGIKNKKWIKMAKQLKINIIWGGWSLRKKLPFLISKCKIGVCCSTNYDSCPRVIPEYLACGLPVIATDNMNFWHDKYITKETGLLVKENKLKEGIDKLLQLNLNPIEYYNNNIHMHKAVDYLKTLIKDIL